MERDRGDRGQRGGLERNFVRHPGDEIRRHAHDLSMVGMASAGAGHSVAYSKAPNRGSHLDDRSCRAVPDRRFLVELAFHRIAG